MDFSFTEAQLLLKNSVHDFLQKECPKSYVREFEDKGEYPEGLFRKMANMGWLGIPVPEEYGGSGGDTLDLVIVGEEIARFWLSLALLWGFSTCFGAKTICSHGNEEQKRLLLPKLSKGELRFAGAFTEPGGGTDLLALTTNATKQNGNWVVNGQKTFITGAQEADYLITIVRTNKNPAKRTDAFTVFLIDTKSNGVEIRRLHKLGLWGLDTNEIFFDDVTVPESSIIGEVNRGFYHLLDTLNNERIVVSGTILGMSQATFEDALEYAKQRYAFGKPIGQFQQIQHYLAQMKIEIDAAKFLLYRAAWMESNGMPSGMEATMADYFTSEVGHKCAVLGMRIMAGAGFMMDSSMQRYYRDSIIPLFAPISNEMCLNQLAQSLGLPRSY